MFNNRFVDYVSYTSPKWIDLVEREISIAFAYPVVAIFISFPPRTFIEKVVLVTNPAVFGSNVTVMSSDPFGGILPS